MKSLIYLAASALLLFNGFGALYGGWHLMSHPDGSSIQMHLVHLQHSPFKDYFIPGLIFFIANGCLSLFIFATAFLNRKIYPRLIIAQGMVLIGWIAIQIGMIRTINKLHFIMGITGILLILCGCQLVKKLDDKIKIK
jgi:hypothetical protein